MCTNTVFNNKIEIAVGNVFFRLWTNKGLSDGALHWRGAKALPLKKGREHPRRLFLAGKMLSQFSVAGFGKNLAMTPQGDTDSHGANVAPRTERNPELLLLAELAASNLLGPLKCDTWFVQSPSKLFLPVRTHNHNGCTRSIQTGEKTPQLMKPAFISYSLFILKKSKAIPQKILWVFRLACSCNPECAVTYEYTHKYTHAHTSMPHSKQGTSSPCRFSVFLRALFVTVRRVATGPTPWATPYLLTPLIFSLGNSSLHVNICFSTKIIQQLWRRLYFNKSHKIRRGGSEDGSLFFFFRSAPI